VNFLLKSFVNFPLGKSLMRKESMKQDYENEKESNTMRYVVSAIAALAAGTLVYAFYNSQQKREREMKEQMWKKHLINYH